MTSWQKLSWVYLPRRFVHPSPHIDDLQTNPRESATCQTIKITMLRPAGCKAFSRLWILRSKIRTRLESTSVVLSVCIYPFSAEIWYRFNLVTVGESIARAESLSGFSCSFECCRISHFGRHRVTPRGSAPTGQFNYSKVHFADSLIGACARGLWPGAASIGRIECYAKLLCVSQGQVRVLDRSYCYPPSS